MSQYSHMAIGVFELDSYLECFVALDAAASDCATIKTAVISNPSEETERLVNEQK